MKYKYSIIIPHHNIPKLLNRCLASMPVRDDVQVIVIDDASDECFNSELKQLEKQYITCQFIYSENSAGAGGARNIGLEYATGEWLIFVDADDYLVQNAYEIWEKHSDSHCDIIYFPSICVDTESLTPRHNLDYRDNIIKRLSPNQNGLHRWLRYCNTEPWGKMIKHDLVAKNDIRFQESTVANDYLFSVKTGHKSNKISLSQDRFYCYTIRQGSLSNNQLSSLDKIRSRLEVYATIQKYFFNIGVSLRPFDKFTYQLLSNDKIDNNQVWNIRSSLGYSKFNFYIGFLKLSYYTLKQKILRICNVPSSGI